MDREFRDFVRSIDRSGVDRSILILLVRDYLSNHSLPESTHGTRVIHPLVSEQEIIKSLQEVAQDGSITTENQHLFNVHSWYCGNTV